MLMAAFFSPHYHLFQPRIQELNRKCHSTNQEMTKLSQEMTQNKNQREAFNRQLTGTVRCGTDVSM